MKRYFTAIVFFLLYLAAQSWAASLEDTYIETRDQFIRQFRKANYPVSRDDRRALNELQRQLRSIIGPVVIDGFPQQGLINLVTLYRGVGFGQVDGLRFSSGKETLLITTVRLLNDYIDRHRTLPAEYTRLAKDGEFYRLVFDWSSVTTHFAAIPSRGAPFNVFTYAFLGLRSQDTGPFVPNAIYVFISNGKYVFVVSAALTEPMMQIADCKETWGEYDKKSASAFEAYRASDLKDKRAFDDYVRYEREGFEMYRTCFGRKAITQPSFASLIRQVQSIVDRIQRQ